MEGPERSSSLPPHPTPGSLLPVKWLSSLTIRAVLFTWQCSGQAPPALPPGAAGR